MTRDFNSNVMVAVSSGVYFHFIRVEFPVADNWIRDMARC